MLIRGRTKDRAEKHMSIDIFLLISLEDWPAVFWFIMSLQISKSIIVLFLKTCCYANL